jgi:cysteine desulfurase
MLTTKSALKFVLKNGHNQSLFLAPVALFSTNKPVTAAVAPTSNADKYQELKKLKIRPLYLDAQATSPIDPRVLDAMMPYMINMYGNPHSRTHAYGWESEKAVEDAREVRKF